MLLPIAISAMGQKTYGEALRDFRREYRLQHKDDPVQITARLGISGYPVSASNYYCSGYLFSFGKYYDDYYIGPSSLSQVYRDYNGPVKTTGTFIGSVDFIFSSGLALSIDGGLGFFWKDIYDGVSGMKKQRETGAALYLMPKFKGYYMRRPLVRLYGSIGLGASKFINFDKLDDDETVAFQTQIVPIGIEVGEKRLFGFMELGFGTVYTGANVGIGYKF